MVSKITSSSIVVLTLILSLPIFANYFIHYPAKFDVEQTLSNMAWNKLLLIIIDPITAE